MDTKLKNNKKRSFLAAAIIVLLFAIGFMALYPTFEKRAADYYTDSLHGEYFLHEIYKSNYILNKDIREKVDGRNYTYEELYFTIKEESAEVKHADEIADIDYIVQEIGAEIAGLFTEWNYNVMNGIAQEMDYCVIDEKTGQIIKNTGKNIEVLAKGEDISAKEALPYAYYIKVTYDGRGNANQISVKSGDSEQLLKSVQRVMKESLDSKMSYLNKFNYYGNAVYYGYDDTTRLRKVTIANEGGPKDVTFVYALTQEQMAKLTGAEWGGNSFLNSWRDEEQAYVLAGVDVVYGGMLAVLTVIAILLLCSRKYCLYEMRIFRIPPEISFFAGLFILSGFRAGELVNYTNRGYFDAAYSRYFPFLSTAAYPVLTGIINMGILILIFGGWFYCVTSFGAIKTYGIKGFVKERSIVARLWKSAVSFCKRHINSFKEEFLNVDLGENVGHTIHVAVFINFVILAVICSIWIAGWFVLIVYSLILYFILKKYIQRIQEQYQKLLKATEAMADGDLNTTFEDEDLGVFESYKEKLRMIQEGFKKAVEEEVKSQRMKTELITNVSHDLKTPLTAITTYIDLLKEENVTPEQRKEYIAVLEKKSVRLKFLIEDLFEVSKANSKNVTMNLVDVDICNLMRQVYLEHADKVEEADLIFRFDIPEEKVVLKLDSQKTYRIFENLYMNIIKYAMPHTRVYVDAGRTENGIRIEMKNMSATELNIAPDELTERFVRGDGSRNTEGSGLGLAIAKSFMELQGGKMKVDIDGDLFKVTLEW